MIMELNTPLKNKTFAYQGFSLIFYAHFSRICFSYEFPL